MPAIVGVVSQETYGLDSTGAGEPGDDGERHATTQRSRRPRAADPRPDHRAARRRLHHGGFRADRFRRAAPRHRQDRAARSARVLSRARPRVQLDTDRTRRSAGVRRAGQGRTTISATASPSTVRNADQIVVLDHGHVTHRYPWHPPAETAVTPATLGVIWPFAARIAAQWPMRKAVWPGIARGCAAQGSAPVPLRRARDNKGHGGLDRAAPGVPAPHLTGEALRALTRMPGNSG